LYRILKGEASRPANQAAPFTVRCQRPLPFREVAGVRSRSKWMTPKEKPLSFNGKGALQSCRRRTFVSSDRYGMRPTGMFTQALISCGEVTVSARHT